MKSISNSACMGKPGSAPALPISTAKEPIKLFVAPDHTPYTRENTDPSSLRAYRTGDILNTLVERGFARFGDAEWKAKHLQHQIELGLPYFTDEQLATARRKLEEAKATMKAFVFFERAGWGMPRTEWDAHTQQLTELLEEAQAEEDGWRFGPPDRDASYLLRALIVLEVSE